MYVLGVDSGSTSTNAVIMNDRKEIKAFAVVRTGAKAGESVQKVLDEVLQKAAFSREDIKGEVIDFVMNDKCAAGTGRFLAAIAAKAFSMLKRVGLEQEFMMTGGVAKNPGVVHAVGEKLEAKLYICPEPEIVGAAGATLYALEKCIA